MDEREAGALREARKRIIDGATLRGGPRVARGRAVPEQGRPAGQVTIADRLLRSPHLLGDRRHRGRVTKQDAWPAVFSPEEHLDLVAELDRRGRPGLVDRHRMLCSGYLYCGGCRHVMRGATLKAAGGRREPGYRCDAASGGCGRLHRLAKPVERGADRIIRRLANPKVQAKLAEQAEGRLTAEQAREVRASLQADRAKLAQLEALATELDPAVVETTKATITGRMLASSRRLRAGIHRGPLAGLPHYRGGAAPRLGARVVVRPQARDHRRAGQAPTRGPGHHAGAGAVAAAPTPTTFGWTSGSSPPQHLASDAPSRPICWGKENLTERALPLRWPQGTTAAGP